MTRDRLAFSAAMIVVAIGIALRLWHVFAEPLWLDEAYSAFAADHPFAFLWQVVPQYETHPPFYYSLLHLWVLVAGDGIVALRLPGVVAGLATLPLIALAANDAARALDLERGRRRVVVLVAVALGSVAVQLVEMTREVRPYPLMILVYAGATLTLVRIHRDARAGRPLAPRRLVLHLVLLALMLWLHNLGLLFAIALTIGLALALGPRWPRGREWAWLVGGHLIVAALWLPALLILRSQAPTWVGATWLHLTIEGTLGHLQMLYAAALPAWACALALAVLAVVGCRARPGGAWLAAMLLVLAVVPVALSLLISVMVAPVFITRTVTPVVVPALLLYALGVGTANGRFGAVAAACAFAILAETAAVDVRLRREGPIQRWDLLVEWLAPRLRPGDRILAYPNEGALPLDYALRDYKVSARIQPVPAPVPAFATPGAWYPSGSRGVVSLTPDRLCAVADAPDLQRVPTIWLLRLRRDIYDRGDMFLHVLRRGRDPVQRFEVGAIEIVGLRRRAPVP